VIVIVTEVHALICRLSEMYIYSNVISLVRKRWCCSTECTVYVWFCHGRNCQQSNYKVTEVRISVEQLRVIRTPGLWKLCTPMQIAPSCCTDLMH